jgi:hypothetical protein
MEDVDTPPSSVALLVDALGHPLRKWTWWFIVATCGVGIFWMLQLIAASHRGGGRLLFIVAAFAAVIARCYFSAMENTITGYGEAVGESSPRMDEFWETLWRVLGAGAMSWGPMIVAAIYLYMQEMPEEPWTSILTALGCEYFPMALLGIVNFGGLHAALPQVVIPAILCCGPFYSIASLSLFLVPYSAQWIYGAFQGGGFWASVAASAIAAYFLVAHARLIGRIYLANRERLGWE